MHAVPVQGIGVRLIEILGSDQLSYQVCDEAALAILGILRLLPMAASRQLMCSIAAGVQRPLRTPAALLILQCCSEGKRCSCTPTFRIACVTWHHLTSDAGLAISLLCTAAALVAAAVCIRHLNDLTRKLMQVWPALYHSQPGRNSWTWY